MGLWTAVLKKIFYVLLASEVFVFALSNPGVERAWVLEHDEPGHAVESPCDLTLDVTGKVYVVASSSPSGRTDASKILTIKYDSNGTELWHTIYSETGRIGLKPCSIVAGPSGCVYVAGEHKDPGRSNDFLIIKYNDKGKRLWVARWDGPNGLWNYPIGMKLDQKGYLYVTGVSKIGTEEQCVVATVSYTHLTLPTKA